MRVGVVRKLRASLIRLPIAQIPFREISYAVAFATRGSLEDYLGGHWFFQPLPYHKVGRLLLRFSSAQKDGRGLEIREATYDLRLLAFGLWRTVGAITVTPSDNIFRKAIRLHDDY